MLIKPSNVDDVYITYFYYEQALIDYASHEHGQHLEHDIYELQRHQQYTCAIENP